MRVPRLLKGTSLIIITVLLALSVLAMAAYMYKGITITTRTEIKEPIHIYRVKGLPSTLWPGDTGTIEFKIENKDSKPYIINCTVKFPWEGDGVADGRGLDVIEFVVGDQNRTEDIRDDGVAHFVIGGGQTLTATIKIKAWGDVPSGTADITIKILRTVVLNDPPKYIHLSWAVNDVYHTMTIMWWTQFDVSGNTVVYDTEHHDKVSEYKFKATATTHQVCAYGKCFPGYWHEVTLTGLQPGTTYYFRVGGPGGWSKEYKFRTIDPNKPVKIVISGDSRRPWGDVAPAEELKYHPERISNFPFSRIWVTKAIAKEDPDALIFVGDMVESGNSWEDWKLWFENVVDNLVTPDGRIIPIIAVIGNHEMGAYPNIESTYAWFKGLFANPGNELWFSLDFPNLHVLALATTGGCVGTWWGPMVKEAEEQVEFIKEDLSSTNAKWKIAVWHVPYYDCYVSGTGYPSEVLLKYWAQLLESYGVNIVFNGHVHNYMRTWPLKTIKVEEVSVNKPWTKVGYKYVYELKHSSEEGTTYVVVGTYGAPTDPYIKGGACSIRPFMASAYARPMYVILEVNSTNIHYIAKDNAGHVLDEVTFPYVVENFTTPEYNFRV